MMRLNNAVNVNSFDAKMFAVDVQYMKFTGFYHSRLTLPHGNIYFPYRYNFNDTFIFFFCKDHIIFDICSSSCSG